MYGFENEIRLPCDRLRVQLLDSWGDMGYKNVARCEHFAEVLSADRIDVNGPDTTRKVIRKNIREVPVVVQYHIENLTEPIAVSLLLSLEDSCILSA